MRVVFFGTPEFAVPTLKLLLNRPEFEVLAVVTQPDKRRGRGNIMMPSEVKKVALEYNLPVYQPKSVKKNKQTLAKLQEAAADAFVVVAYGQILSKQILDMPKLGCVNVHGSILPRYRGAAPVQWSIYHGATETGITTMLMDEGMDTGAMLLKAYTPIGLLDNAQLVAATLAQQGADLLIETLLKLQTGEIQAIVQNPAEATYASLISNTDFTIDWERSAIAIHNQVRAFFPNCVASFRGNPLKVITTIPLGEIYYPQLPPEYKKLEQHSASLSSLAGKPGEIVSIIKNFGAVVQTGEGVLLLKEIQLAGKRPQSGWDFVNGTRPKLGEILTN